ncbi:O-antigen ligase family protein [Polaribacter staleyi]|uniref:O-antigen ligase family protein n=1 Tax=Polaribacter staleyi TaxID=2022337 RepID=UPI0031BAD982
MRYFLYLISSILLFISYANISDSIVFQVFPFFMLLLVLINETLLAKEKIVFLKKDLIILPFFILIIVIGILISSKPELNIYYKIFKAFSLPLFVFTSFKCIYNNRREGFLSNFLKFIYMPLLFYVILNLLTFLMGLSGDDSIDSKAVLMSYIGIDGTRVKFFLSVGVNAYGALLGILLTLSLVGFSVVKIKKKYFLLGIVVSMISLFLTDSRGPMLYSILIFFIIKLYFFNIKKPRFLNFIPLIGFFGPFLFLAFLSFLATTDYGESLSRSTADLASGNSRLTIWSIAITDFLSFKPDRHIFGYGEFGHYTSGLSPHWSFVFDNQKVNDFVHPHNTFLSIMFDYGYFGLFIYVFFQYKIIRVIKSNWINQKELSMLLLANLLYFNLVGIGETMFGFYYKNIMYVFFIINIFALIYNEKKIKLNEK